MAQWTCSSSPFPGACQNVCLPAVLVAVVALAMDWDAGML